MKTNNKLLLPSPYHHPPIPPLLYSMAVIFYCGLKLSCKIWLLVSFIDYICIRPFVKIINTERILRNLSASRNIIYILTKKINYYDIYYENISNIYIFYLFYKVCVVVLVVEIWMLLDGWMDFDCRWIMKAIETDFFVAPVLSGNRQFLSKFWESKFLRINKRVCTQNNAELDKINNTIVHRNIQGLEFKNKLVWYLFIIDVLTNKILYVTFFHLQEMRKMPSKK